MTRLSEYLPTEVQVRDFLLPDGDSLSGWGVGPQLAMRWPKVQHHFRLTTNTSRGAGLQHCRYLLPVFQQNTHVHSRASQGPLRTNRFEPTPKETAETQNMFDLTDPRLHRLSAKTVS